MFEFPSFLVTKNVNIISKFNYVDVYWEVFLLSYAQL
jgi:hypothetical protein